MENIEDFLRELRASSKTRWIANDIDETLSEGVSMNVKDAITDSNFFELLPSQDLPIQEKNKRKKYETSRPLNDEEKIQVILKAIEVTYLDLPAIQQSAIKNINELDGNIRSITFSSSDVEKLEDEVMPEIHLNNIDKKVDEYRNLHSNFIGELDK